MKFAENPLSGKSIVLTRTPEQAGILLHELKGSGARVTTLPFIEIREPEDWGPVDAALARIQDFDWLVFTSQNGVAYFCKRLRQRGLDPANLPLPRPQIAAIGAATAEAATREGFTSDILVTNSRSGKEFIVEIRRNTRGKKILLPQGDLAKDYMAEGLKAGGADVTAVAAYRTCMPTSVDGEELQRIRREGADAFVFASPSAFDNFAKTVGPQQMQEFARTAAFAAIGPTTADAIRKAGVPVRIEAATPSSKDMIGALRKYFGAVTSGAKRS